MKPKMLAPLPMSDGVYYCPRCGHAWDPVQVPPLHTCKAMPAGPQAYPWLGPSEDRSDGTWVWVKA